MSEMDLRATGAEDKGKAGDGRETWPALPLEEWKDTYDTLHMWTQIIGKVRAALSPTSITGGESLCMSARAACPPLPFHTIGARSISNSISSIIIWQSARATASPN